MSLMKHDRTISRPIHKTLHAGQIWRIFALYQRKNLTKMSRKLLNVAPHIKKSATADLTVELEVLQAELTVAVFCRNGPSDNTFT